MLICPSGWDSAKVSKNFDATALIPVSRLVHCTNKDDLPQDLFKITWLALEPELLSMFLVHFHFRPATALRS